VGGSAVAATTDVGANSDKSALHTSIHTSIHTAIHTSIHSDIHSDIPDGTPRGIHSDIQSGIHSGIYSSARRPASDDWECPAAGGGVGSGLGGVGLLLALDGLQHHSAAVRT